MVLPKQVAMPSSLVVVRCLVRQHVMQVAKLTLPHPLMLTWEIGQNFDLP